MSDEKRSFLRDLASDYYNQHKLFDKLKCDDCGCQNWNWDETEFPDSKILLECKKCKHKYFIQI